MWTRTLTNPMIPENSCRDCANGFLVAELLSRYFPKEVNMRTYENGLSSRYRNDNWMQIQDSCRKHGFQLPGELVSAVMREQHGAAVELLELLYEHLTGKKLLRPGDVRTTLPTVLSFPKRPQTCPNSCFLCWPCLHIPVTTSNISWPLNHSRCRAAHWPQMPWSFAWCNFNSITAGRH